MVAPLSDRPASALRVLLIDDGAHRVELIRTELMRQSHEVVGVGDAALLIHDGVQRLAPDVVIVDSESRSRALSATRRSACNSAQRRASSASESWSSARRAGRWTRSA